MELHHQKDLKFQKEQWNALEKVKRDKWIQEKSQAIRDQTIKGLEPEVQRMLAVLFLFSCRLSGLVLFK